MKPCKNNDQNKNSSLNISLHRRSFLKKTGIAALSLGVMPHLITGCEDDEILDTSAFTFVVISDTHVRLPGNSDDVTYDNQGNIDNLDSVVAKINNEYSYADLVVVTGDLVGCLYSDNADDYLIGEENPAETFKEVMDKLTIPYYCVLGNHDYQKSYDAEKEEGIMTDDIEKIEAVWKKVLEIDPYYSFVHRGVRFVVLNSNRGSAKTAVCVGTDEEAFCTGSFDDEQLEWLKGELNKAEPCILFCHHPPFSDDSSKLWSYATDGSFQIVSTDGFYEIASSYKNKIKGIFVGHGHVWAKDTLNQTIQVYETRSTGDTNGGEENVHVIYVDSERNLDVSITDPYGIWNNIKNTELLI